jgi:hypothetical protein
MGRVEAKSKRANKPSSNSVRAGSGRIGSGKVRAASVQRKPKKVFTDKQLLAQQQFAERAADRRRLASSASGKPDNDGASPQQLTRLPEPIPATETGPTSQRLTQQITVYPAGFDDGEWQDGGVRGRVFVCGKPNSGKSYLLDKRVSGCGRVVLFNTMGVASFDGLSGWQHCSQPGELEDILDENFDGGFKVIYTPRSGTKEAHFDAVCARVNACGRMVFAVDEVDTFMSPNYMPKGLYDVMNYGRHARMAFIGTARNTVQVARQFTSNLTEIDIFCMTEPRYLKYFADTCGESVTAEVPRLPTYSYIRWNTDGSYSIANGWR